MKYYLFGALMIIFFGCSSTAHQKSADYRSLAMEKYGADVSYLYNTPESAVICIRKQKPDVRNPLPALNFFVFDLSKQKAVHEAEIPGGSVRWLDDYRLEVKSKHEVMTRNEELMPRSYIIDIRKID